MANGVITKAATVGIKNWFQKRTFARVLLRAGEQALVFFSKRHYRQAQYKKRQCQECHEGSSPGTTGSGGHVHKVLEAAWHLALGGLVKVDGYIRQEEAGDEVVNVQA
jgi:hypothetical protein